MKQILTDQPGKQSKPRKLSKLSIIGVDEAGRGAWAGPVVAACVCWSGRNPIRGVLGDSKTLKPREREKTYEEIFKLYEQGKLTLGVGVIDASVIDEVGIREANRRAMEEALRSMCNVQCSMCNEGFCLKIDGRDNYIFDIPDLPKPEYVVRGDSKIKQIMAASIIAKVTRDRLMIEYESTLPGYGFEKHKGYGTTLHQKTLRELGVCEIHRKSYKPVKLIQETPML